MPQTIQQALNQAAAQIKTISNQAHLEAEDLLGYLIKHDRVYLHAHPEKIITNYQYIKYKKIINQRAKGQPIAYLMGEQGFYGLSFITKPGALIPRQESEQLIDLALGLIPEKSRWQIADIGTGSGCLAITLAKQRPNCRLMAVEKSLTALQIARQNIGKHKLTGKIKLFKGNLLKPLSKNKLDLIIANLPYGTPSEIDSEPSIKHEPRMAINGGPDGLSVFGDFFKQLKQRSNHPIIALEIDPRRKKGLSQLIKNKLPNYQATWKKDFAGHWRFGILKPISP